MSDAESSAHDRTAKMNTPDEATALTNFGSYLSKQKNSVHDSNYEKLETSIETIECTNHHHADEKLSNLWKDALDTGLSSPEVVQVALDKTFSAFRQQNIFLCS